MENKEKKRLNVYLDSEQKEFVETESKRLGITQTALMSIALEQYKEKRMTIDVLPQLMQAMSSIKELEKMTGSLNGMKIDKLRQLMD